MILLYLVVLALCLQAFNCSEAFYPGRCYSPNNVFRSCTETLCTPAKLVIFQDLPLTCSGYIEFYDFKPINNGTVYVGVFRPAYETPDQWKLIGFNKIQVRLGHMKKGHWHAVQISYARQIKVVAGDVLGFFMRANETKQVIGFKTDGSSRIIRSSNTYENMTINNLYGGTSETSRKSFGLNAVINPIEMGYCESPVHPMEQLSRNSSGHLNIFADLKFQCEGFLEVIDFYASKVGKFYISAWRPFYGNDQKWTLVGWNEIKATSVGAHFNHTIPRDQQFIVKANDVLGIFYDKRAVGVVPYENYFKSDRDIVHMSKVHVSQTYSDELEKGSEVSGLLNEGMNKRVPAINVRIVDEKNFKEYHDKKQERPQYIKGDDLEEFLAANREREEEDTEETPTVPPSLIRNGPMIEDARILSPYPDCSGAPVLTSCPGEDEEYEKRTQSQMLKVKLIPTDENIIDDEKCFTAVETRNCWICPEKNHDSKCLRHFMGVCVQYDQNPFNHDRKEYCNDLGYGRSAHEGPRTEVTPFPCEDFDSLVA